MGIQEGNHLIAAWGPEAGIVSYEIKGDELLGCWAAAGANRMGIEDLVRVSPARKNTTSVGVTTPSPITFEELTKNMEKALGSINSMTYESVLRYRPKGTDTSQYFDVIKSLCWFKKPGSHRIESVTTYSLTSEKRKNVYINQLGKTEYLTYELLNDGSVEKTSYPVSQWETSGYPPDTFYVRIKQRINDGSRYSIEYQKDQNVYLLKFDSPDQAVFEISGESWLPYSITELDIKNSIIVETVWSNIKINPEISDDMFRVPEDRK